MYIYHLHSYKQIGQEKYFNGEVIRFLLEDDIYAENNNLDFLDLIYGTASRYDLRSKIYPSFMTYRKWIELSKNYSTLILSINFDVHSWKYKNFCKKILEYFPRNKRIIVAAGNEVYEKRGSAEKVYQTAKEVHEAMQETQRIFPIAFWNEKIYTSGEKSALEKLLNDDRVKDICGYFAYQSLGTTNYSIDKYVKLAKRKGFKIIDIEAGTKTSNFDTLKKKVDLAIALGIKDLVIMCPVIHINLANYSDIWKKYGLAIYYGNNKFLIKDKYKLISYVQQFRTKIFIGDDDMKLYILKKGVKGNFVRWLQEILEVEYDFENEYHDGWDGDFGSLTEKQVKAYQKANNLPINGIIEMEEVTNLLNKAEKPRYWMIKLKIFMAYEN